MSIWPMIDWNDEQNLCSWPNLVGIRLWWWWILFSLFVPAKILFAGTRVLCAWGEYAWLNFPLSKAEELCLVVLTQQCLRHCILLWMWKFKQSGNQFKIEKAKKWSKSEYRKQETPFSSSSSIVTGNEWGNEILQLYPFLISVVKGWGIYAIPCCVGTQ